MLPVLKHIWVQYQFSLALSGSWQQGKTENIAEQPKRLLPHELSPWHNKSSITDRKNWGRWKRCSKWEMSLLPNLHHLQHHLHHGSMAFFHLQIHLQMNTDQFWFSLNTLSSTPLDYVLTFFHLFFCSGLLWSNPFLCSDSWQTGGGALKTAEADCTFQKMEKQYYKKRKTQVVYDRDDDDDNIFDSNRMQISCKPSHTKPLADEDLQNPNLLLKVTKPSLALAVKDLSLQDGRHAK